MEMTAEDAGAEVSKVKHDTVERSPQNASSSDTKITVKAERTGSLETAQAVTEKAKAIKATE